MTAINNLFSRTVDANSRTTTSAQLKADIEKLRLARQKVDASKQTDPAYIVEISDTARSMSQQTNKAESKIGEANSPAASSLFTKAGRTETAQRYDQVLADLRANHDEDEALKLFGEFMKSEGYETKDINEINIAAFATLDTGKGGVFYTNGYDSAYFSEQTQKMYEE